MAITRLSGGTTPPNGSDPRTFPAIWNDAVDDIEALELPITADRLAKTAGAVMVFDDATARATAIPTPVEGMVTYLKDTDQVSAFTGSAFTAVGGILQVVSTALTTATSVTVTPGNISSDIPGLTRTITPTSATSLVAVSFSVALSVTDGATAGHIVLLRDGSPVGVATDAQSRRPATSATVLNIQGEAAISAPGFFLDSPATTSPVTYTLRVGTSSGINRTIFVNRGNADSNGINFGRYISTLTATEVAG